MRPDARRFALLLVSVTVVGGVVRWAGASSQPPLLDEVQVAFTAEGYVSGGQTLPTMPHHPNLRNLLVWGSMALFGASGMGLRFFSLLTGTLSVPLLGGIVLRMTGRPGAALLAALFLASDPLHVAFSRQAVQEAHVVFLSLAGVWLVLEHLRRAAREAEPRLATDALLPSAGFVFGLALASKYQAILPMLVCAVWVGRRALHDRDPSRGALAVTSLVVLPLAVLLLTDLPWFTRGYDLGDWVFMRRAVFARMSSHYLPSATEVNPDRTAWAWFLRPLLGYATFSVVGGRAVLSVGFGNPLVWLLVLPAGAYLALDSGRRQRAGGLLALFGVTYVPFLLTSRPIFFLTALAVAPFAFGLVAVALEELAAGGRRRALAAYVVAVVAVSAALLPPAVGNALEYRYTTMLTARFSPHPGGAPALP